MIKKLYFLMYLQADLGEIELYGSSKETNRVISIDADSDEKAFDLANKKWKNISDAARANWNKLNRAHSRQQLANKKFKEKGQLDKIKPVKKVEPLPSWRPHAPRLISRIDLKE